MQFACTAQMHRAHSHGVMNTDAGASQGSEAYSIPALHIQGQGTQHQAASDEPAVNDKGTVRRCLC